MAKNYVAKTYLRDNTRRIIPNTEIGNVKMSSTVKKENIPMNIGLLNKDNLDMSAFKELYTPGDTEKAHPYYVAVVGTPGYTGIPGVNKKKIKVGDYGPNSLTFINIEDTPVARLGILKDDDYAQTGIQTYTNEQISKDKDHYSIANVYDRTNNTTMLQKGMYVGDWNTGYIDNTINMLGSNVFEGHIRGIPPIKNINPETKEETLNIGAYANTNLNIVEILKLGSGLFEMYFQNSTPHYTMNKLKLSEKHPGGYKPYLYMTDNPGEIKGFNPTYFDILSDGKKYTARQYRPTTYNIKDFNMGFAFLYDGKDYWIMTVKISNVGRVVKAEEHKMECAYVVALMKVQDMPSSFSNATVSEGLSVNFAYRDTPNYINEVSKLLQVVEPVKDKYDGDGPDPVGPGDPYEGDAGNAENSTPTKPNMKEDITLDNADPNEHFNQFMVQSGIFGGYLLTPTNLQRYSSTLEMLYENSKGILHGADASFWADRLQNSVTGLFMLPFNALDGAHSTVSNFVVGNTPVATNNDFQAYTDGTNYSPAALITKPTYVTEVDMGYLNENYDNFMDFASHSKVSLYNPYHNKVELPLNLIQSTSSQKKHLKERIVIDIYSGNIMYMLFCDGMFISHWTANCAKPIPLSVSDVRSAVNEGLGKISALVGATTTTVGSLSKGGIGNTNMGGMASAFQQFLGANSMSMTSGGVHMIGNDSVDGSVGWLGEQDIILTVERAEAWRPDGYGGMSGYPTKKIFKLAEAKGLVEVEDIKLKCNATDQEKQELKSILAGGILL